MERRRFLAALAAPALGRRPARPMLCIFSKHMARFGWDELGATASRLGFEGVDLTVRPKGHVAPERVAEELPKAVEAIRRHGLEVPMVTTDLKDASDPAAKPTFAAMQALGIRLYKPGYWSYASEPRVESTVGAIRRRLEGLLALGRDYGVAAGLHNHSGRYFGCAIWDYREILRGVPPERAGYYFDPGHAVIEGGLFNWRVSLDVVLGRMKMSAVKDFVWERSGGRWRVLWRPLGEGMVPWEEVFSAYARAGFQGPLSLHLEYAGGDDLGSIGRDLEYLKRQVERGYRAGAAPNPPDGTARPKGSTRPELP